MEPDRSQGQIDQHQQPGPTGYLLFRQNDREKCESETEKKNDRGGICCSKQQKIDYVYEQKYEQQPMQEGAYR